MRDPTAEQLELAATFEQMIKVGWARPDSAFRRVFTTMMIPGADEEQMRWLDELQRVVGVGGDGGASPVGNARRPTPIHLLPQIDQPTLVLHSLGDQMNDFADSRHLAANIAGARLVALDSGNHIVLEDEPAWPVFRRGGARVHRAGPARRVGLGDAGGRRCSSPREVEVLRLAAEGLDNDGIAAELFLSVRTVERHLQNAYAKLGVQGKAARTAAVARFLTSS